VDVNGTSFHLVYGEADWSNCQEEDSSGGAVHLEWNSQSEMLGLRPLPVLFPRGKRAAFLDPSARRGAAADRFGNWYWIGNDRQRIFWKPSGSGRPHVYWTQTPPCQPASPGDFYAHTESHPIVAELASLAVTEHHYLVVGNVTQGGLFLFDLHAGGEPLLLLFPQLSFSPAQRFEPFDMAPAPGGGVWVLDRTHRSYWGLDCQFRVVTEQAFLHEIDPGEAFTFRRVGGPIIVPTKSYFPEGFPIAAQNPVSIEGMPDGSVLILDSPELSSSLGTSPATSVLYHYRLDSQESPPVPLPDLVGISTGREERRPIIGHDMAYTIGEKPDENTLYVVERDGNQAIAFTLDFQAAKPLTVKRDYLPMHSFGSRALVAADGKVFYDVTGGDPTKDPVVRWLQLQVIDQPRYERSATVLTPIFDGKERGCIWHRLFLDACIPRETTVKVWTRTHSEQTLLDNIPFSPEPDLYLRGAGPEIPYYAPFPGRERLPERMGTWELLLQQAHGRYLQVKLVLTGNGRNTPQLRALRTYYPRFSYLKQYLPAVYQEDAESASFVERLLANMEGFYTEIEGKIAEVSTLFDARTARAEALNWLAGWIGLILDPLWERIQERRLASQEAMKRAPDRRRLCIRYALSLYARRGTSDGIKFALHLLLHPCLETTLRRFKAAAVRLDVALQDELATLGLPYPTAVMSEEQLEALLRDYILAPSRPSKVRIVERFLTRGGRATAAGDPTRSSEIATSEDTIQASAHRFSVLLPESLSPEEEAMVMRIVGLEKPAHTQFDIRRYWDYFRVGEVRLGIDTVLGEKSRFAPMILGRDYLAEGYLYPAPPMDASERLITDRDSLDETCCN
jgi:phage tail-like protein